MVTHTFVHKGITQNTSANSMKKIFEIGGGNKR